MGQNFAANGCCDDGIWLVCQKNAQKIKLATRMTGSMNTSTLTTLVNLVPVSSTSRNFCASAAEVVQRDRRIPDIHIGIAGLHDRDLFKIGERDARAGDADHTRRDIGVDGRPDQAIEDQQPEREVVRLAGRDCRRAADIRSGRYRRPSRRSRSPAGSRAADRRALWNLQLHAPVLRSAVASRENALKTL